MHSVSKLHPPLIVESFNRNRNVSYITGYLFAAQLMVIVLIDQLEDVRFGRLGVANVDQFHLEDERRTARNHFARTAIAVAQRRRNRQLAFLAYCGGNANLKKYINRTC